MSNKVEEIKFRCSPFEKSIIKQKAHQTGRTVSEYCRAQSVNGKIVSKPNLTEEEKEFFRILKNHTGSFSSIANFIKTRNPNLHAEIYSHLNNMKKLYSKFFPE